MTAVLEDRDRANLLALVMERLVQRATGRRPSGTYLLRAGAMSARLAFEPERTVVRSGDGPADCTIEGSLQTLAELSLGASAVAAWWRGKVRWRGSPLRALKLAAYLRR